MNTTYEKRTYTCVKDFLNARKDLSELSDDLTRILIKIEEFVDENHKDLGDHCQALDLDESAVATYIVKEFKDFLDERFSY